MSTPGELDGRRAQGEGTRARILDAAHRALADGGYAATTTRAIAERADVRLSLVHYHFGGRQELLAAVLERENERLLERQRALYAGSEPLADKWRAACAYLREDIRSGYVRALWELWAAGLADERLAARWRDAVASWHDLLTSVVADWIAERDIELPATARELATLVADLFLGAEAELLAGMSERHAPQLDALERCAELIEWAETRTRDGRD
jgi:AcrR family transcriptional regulator